MPLTFQTFVCYWYVSWNSMNFVHIFYFPLIINLKNYCVYIFLPRYESANNNNKTAKLLNINKFIKPLPTYR